MKTIEAFSINKDGMNYKGNCPNCDREVNFTGYFDPDSLNTCKCGCIFKIDKVWIDENKFI